MNSIVTIYSNKYIPTFKYNYVNNFLCKQMYLNDIELFFIDYYLGFKKWELLYITYNSVNRSKTAYVLFNSKVFSIFVPPLLYSYKTKDIYKISTRVVWVTPKKKQVIKYYSIYRFKEFGYYVGYINKRGWKIKKIDKCYRQLIGHCREFENVSLMFDLKSIKQNSLV